MEEEVYKHLTSKAKDTLFDFFAKQDKCSIKLNLNPIDDSKEQKEEKEEEIFDNEEDEYLKKYVIVELNPLSIDQLFEAKIGFEIVLQDFKFGLTSRQKTIIFLYSYVKYTFFIYIFVL